MWTTIIIKVQNKEYGVSRIHYDRELFKKYKIEAHEININDEGNKEWDFTKEINSYGITLEECIENLYSFLYKKSNTLLPPKG